MTAIQTRALAAGQPHACPSHWASLCPGGKCLLANSPSRFFLSFFFLGGWAEGGEGGRQWRRERKKKKKEKKSLCPLHLSPSPLLLLWVGCYITDTSGSQAAQHRSTVAYTITLQTVTDNFHYPSQIKSSASLSGLNSSCTFWTRGLCPFCCDRTRLHFVPPRPPSPPRPGNWGQSSSSDPFFEPDQLHSCQDCREKQERHRHSPCGAHSDLG